MVKRPKGMLTLERNRREKQVFLNSFLLKKKKKFENEETKFCGKTVISRLFAF